MKTLPEAMTIGEARIRAARRAMLSRRRAAGLTSANRPKSFYSPKFKVDVGARICSAPTW
jgi:hypothetical protein